jgi:zinc/manganese transport system permease protein
MTTLMTLITSLFDYEFMRNAFVAGSIAAVVASIVGYFVILRSLAFAGHALSHISFAGAAGAGLIHLQTWTGQLLLTLLAAAGMGALGERMSKSDIAIGIILAFSLGLGVLFLHLYTQYAGEANAILFGNLLGVSRQTLQWMFLIGTLSIVALGIISRPLLFASLDPELAEAKGLSLKRISILFFLIIAIAVTQASQVVGVLLVFTLLIGPAATALRLTREIGTGIALSIFLGLITVWSGIVLGYITDWPISFWISSISLLFYLLSFVIRTE